VSERYVVQEKFPPLGVEGQKLLRKSSVVLVGVGGLGTFIAQYLVRAGQCFQRQTEIVPKRWL